MKTMFSPKAWSAMPRILALAAFSLCILGVGSKKAAAQPATAPVLTSATSNSSTSATLTWTQPHHGHWWFRARYGTSSGQYTAQADLNNVRRGTISRLTPGTTYYFVVIAFERGNPTPSAPSNELSVRVGATPNYQEITSWPLIFDDEFNDSSTIDRAATGNSGFNWYPEMFFGFGTNPSNDYSVSGGVLTINNANDNWNDTLHTAHPANNASGWAGTCFAGGSGIYFEASIAVSNLAHIGGSSGWPSFWLDSIKRETGIGNGMLGWPGVTEACEPDIMEYNPTWFSGNTQEYLFTLHDWMSAVPDGGFGQSETEGVPILLPGKGGRIVDSAQNIWTIQNAVVTTHPLSPCAFENGSIAGHNYNVAEMAYVGGIIWVENTSGKWYSWKGSSWVAGNPGEYHRYGMLYIPARASNGWNGYAQAYFDGVAGDKIPWVGNQTYSGPMPPTSASIMATHYLFSEMDRDLFMLILGSSTLGTTTMSVDYVRVYALDPSRSLIQQ